MAPPAGNTNAARHRCLALGELPKGKGLGYVQRCVYEFRRQLEADVKASRGGDLTLYVAALIDTASRHHRGCLLAHKWLRDKYAELPEAERLRINDMATEYAEKRDRALKALGLADSTATTADPWAEAMAEIHGGKP